MALPDRWSAAPVPAAAPAGCWWEALGGEPLARLVAEALERNHDLEAAAARLEAARAQTRIAGADLLPAVGATFSATRVQQNFIGFPIPGGGDVLTTRSTRLSAGFDLAWEVDLWGRLRAGRSAAVGDAEAAAAEERAARLSLAARTARLHFALLESEGQLELARETLESFRRTTEQVRERYERGLRPSLDVRLAVASEETARALVARRAEELDGLRRELEVLLGRYPSGEITAAGELPEELPEVPAGLPADLLARRPDLVALERRLAAAGARTREARASLFPRLSLTAAGGTQSSELRDLVNGDFSVWTLAGNLLQPVFQGGRLRAGLELAEAREVEAMAAYAQGVLRALSEVESALAAERHLDARVDALRRAAAASQAARELAVERYRRGLEDFITLLEAQRRELDARTELLAARNLRLGARVELHLALGGGFESGPGEEIATAPHPRAAVSGPPGLAARAPPGRSVFPSPPPPREPGEP